MNEGLQPFFINYIKYYIDALTEGREEFFLSLCDIEEIYLEKTRPADFTGYQVVVVDKADYSEAVRHRNDISVRKIVLLSGEGVKQIDSLKDFNEYSVLPQNKTLLWECLEKTFGVALEPRVRIFLEGILEQSEVFFGDLFAYLQKSISKERISPLKLNQNLPMLGIWKSQEKEVLNKGKIRRMIRNSRYSVVDSRLTGALMNHKIGNEKQERLISSALSKGDMQRIFSGIAYEDMEKHLKQIPREKNINLTEAVSAEEKSYGNSYEFKVMENLPDDILTLEREWISDRYREDAEVEIDWSRYSISPAEGYLSEKKIRGLIADLEDCNLPAAKREKCGEKLQELLDAFIKVREVVCTVTPVCLEVFCHSTEEYTGVYFELLSDLITDEMFRDMDAGRELIRKILLLFCRERNDRIRMPFFHPVRVFYYRMLRGLYKSILAEEESDELKNLVLLTLTDKAAMQFPVEFMQNGEKRYALDNMTIQQGYTDFVSTDAGTVYSVTDFKIVQQQILDHIIQNPYMTDFTICLVDISDLSGLPGLAARVREMAGKDAYQIGRVDFLILSSREEELRKKLSQMWDTVGSDDIVRFRFARNSYSVDGKYDLERIVEEADMIIMADNALLYREPRMTARKGSGNALYNRLKKCDLNRQVEECIRSGRSDISVIWDTMQQIAFGGQEGFWEWKSRELDSRILEFINRTMQEQTGKSVVILSSNEQILSGIYQTRYMKAYRKKYNGKSMTILRFDSAARIYEEGEEGRITCSLAQLYDEALGLEEMPGKLIPGLLDLLLDIRYETDGISCRCQAVVREEGTELASDWKEVCGQWLNWQFHDFPGRKNILTDYFRELWRNQLNAGGRGILSILLAENLCREGRISYSYEDTCLNPRREYRRAETDCMLAVKVHELLRFVKQKSVIDERAVSQFRERYDQELPERILETEDCRRLLEEREIQQLIKLRERTGDDRI